MKIFGVTIARTKSLQSLSPADSGRGWLSWWAGRPETDFQRDIKLSDDCILAYSPVFSCITLIAADFGKLRVKLTELQPSGIWKETTSPSFSPVLRKPNHYQNHIQFKESWMISKLSRGNAYALKQRDNRGVVTALYILDPCRTLPLVAPDGSIFYQLGEDNLNGLQDATVIVPASEIIHDRMNCLFHPLVGLSPIFAAGLAATQGLSIQNNSAHFFKNGSKPGGVLTAAGAISDATAARLKEHWDANYTGENAGKVAVLGDGLKYEAMAVTATDAQLIEQLKWTAETVCSCFHVPAYKIGVGTMPNYTNIEALQQDYYSTCLQSLIESFELCMDEGLAVPANYGTELDLRGLMRMDTATRYKANTDAITGGWLSPNEARKSEDLEPVEGGDSPMVQQQNYSLAALAKRDALADPFGKTAPPTPTPTEDPAPDDGSTKAVMDELAFRRQYRPADIEQFRKRA